MSSECDPNYLVDCIATPEGSSLGFLAYVPMSQILYMLEHGWEALPNLTLRTDLDRKVPSWVTENKVEIVNLWVQMQVDKEYVVNHRN